MKVVIRADASNHIGTGHVVRCRTLAESLRDRDADVCFICRDHAGNLIDSLSTDSIAVTVLPGPTQPVLDSEDYVSWLGVSQSEDAAQTLAALGGDHPDWLVVDHYGLDAEWEKIMRPQVRRIMVIDDLTNRPHDVDLLLNQNFSFRGEDRYTGLVPRECRLLMGPRYALLRSEYAAYRDCFPHRDGLVRRVFLFLGGTDPSNVTGMALKALCASEFSDLNVDVVVGLNNPRRQMVARLAADRPHTHLHAPRPHLADLMAHADLAVGAGGATTWERLCLGLPSLVVSIADNQRPTCEALQEAGLIHYAGHDTDLNEQQLRDRLSALIADSQGLLNTSERGSALVDGLGVERLAEFLNPTPREQLRIRPARERDTTPVLTMSIATDESQTPRETRRETLPHGLSSDYTHQFVLDAWGLPVGWIGFHCRDDETLVTLRLDSLLKSRDLDAVLLRHAADTLRAIRARYLNGETELKVAVPAGSFMRLPVVQEPVPNMDRAAWSIAVLSDGSSWINDWIPQLIQGWLTDGHRVLWAHEIEELRPADFCFYLSCGQIVPASVRGQFRHNLVVHESDLPQGKGWSPLTWQIIEGKNTIPVTLFEAVDRVDSGVIYAREIIQFQGHELIDELRTAQAEATIRLCENFVDGFPSILDQAREQSGTESFFPRRRPTDSRLDPDLPLAKQFSLLRVTDNLRYPAYFDQQGQTYELTITKRKE